MERKTNKRGVVFLVIGLILISVAGGWYLYNTVEDVSAGKDAAELLEKLEMVEEQQAEQGKQDDPNKQEDPDGREEPDGQDKTEASPVIIVEGEAFCGKLAIEKLGIELPVYDEWNYTRLKTAPCRYIGGVGTNDIIIAAHNYKSHFGNLKKLQIGDEVLFTDGYGTQHRYSVKEITTLDGTAVTDMKSGEWDFTLFTCTKGGEQRVTVRCTRITDE